MDKAQLKCQICNKPAFSIYKHQKDPVYFCSMLCAGKYNNTNKHANTACMQFNLPTPSNNNF